MMDGELTQPFSALFSEEDENLAPVDVAARTPDEPALLGAVDEFGGAVVLELEALGEFTDRRRAVRRHPFDGEEELMLLRFKIGRPRDPLTDAQEAAQPVAKLRQRPVLGVRDLLLHFGLSLDKVSCYDIL